MEGPAIGDLDHERRTNVLNVGYSSANYYLIRQSSEYLLIDAGMPGTLPKFLNILKRKRVLLQDVRHLLVTHYHPDHAGIVQEIKLKGIDLIVLESQAPFMLEMNRYMEKKPGFQEIGLDDNTNIRFKDSRGFLHDRGFDGEIISTPGHSDDSISLVLDEGIAFTGDLPGSAWDEKTRHQVEISWQKIRSLNAEIIYPGHGPVRHLG